MRLLYFKLYIQSYVIVATMLVTVDLVRHRHYKMSLRSQMQNPGIGAGAHGADVDREPKIKMMERVTRNFLQGRTARITLILQATRPVSIRWFYQDPHVGKRLDGSEVPGYMPLQGNPRFSISDQRAGDVIAYTVKVHNFRLSLLPMQFETLISTNDGVMQYNLGTRILAKHRRKVFHVDSPDWDKFPASFSEYTVNGPFEADCQVFVPLELERPEINALNELKMNKFVLEHGLSPRPEVIARVIRDSNPWNATESTEQKGSDPLVIEKIRRPVREHAIYELRRYFTNAAADLEGKYQCVFKRQPHTSYIDKSYVMGTIKKRSDVSDSVYASQTSNINVTMIPCNYNEYQEDLNKLDVVRGTDTCLRCKGQGQSEVGLFTETYRPVSSMAGVYEHKYVNVAAAGVHEVLYVFRDVGDEFRNTYHCVTQNPDGTQSKSFTFRIEIEDN